VRKIQLTERLDEKIIDICAAGPKTTRPYAS